VVAAAAAGNRAGSGFAEVKREREKGKLGFKRNAKSECKSEGCRGRSPHASARGIVLPTDHKTTTPHHEIARFASSISLFV
jgi:hypothetical protein